MSSQITGLAPEGGSSNEFGANEWLVDEMYERFLADRNSVDQSWWPILEKYQPVDTSELASRTAEAVPAFARCR